MIQPSAHRSPGFFGALHTLLTRGRLRPAGSRVPERQGRCRLRVEALEDRTLLAVQLLGHYNGLDAFSNPGTPPDTVGAAGPTSYVETVNGAVAIYTPKDTGASSVSDSSFHFFFVTGGLPHASPNSGAGRIGDTTMVWDDQVQRFILADIDIDLVTGACRFDIAVSNSASPATLTQADWNFYTFDTSEAGFYTDYPGN